MFFKRLCMRLLMYATAIFLPAWFGFQNGVPSSSSGDTFRFIVVAACIGGGNAYLYRERLDGRVVLNHPLAFPWSPLFIVVGFLSTLGGAFFSRVVHSQNEFAMGIAYSFFVVAITGVEKVLEEGPSGWGIYQDW